MINTSFVSRSLAIFAATIGLTLATVGPVHATPVNLVTNGSFETGDFTGWTLTGNTGFTGVECPGAPFAGPGQGNCDAFLGPIGSDGILSQTIATGPGQYQFDFYFQSDGGRPSDFSASFGGVTYLNVTNPAAGPYALYSFLATATSANPTVSFSFRDDPGFLKLDGISVTATVPEPASLTLMGIGLAGMFARRRAQKRANRA